MLNIVLQALVQDSVGSKIMKYNNLDVMENILKFVMHYLPALAQHPNAHPEAPNMYKLSADKQDN